MGDELVFDQSASSEVPSEDSSVPADPPTEEVITDDNSVSLPSPAPALAAVGSAPFSSASTGTYYELASRVVDNSVFPVDYLFLRDGQYSYILYVGDIEFNGRVATSDGVSYTRWSRNDSSYDYLETHGTTAIDIDCGSFTCFASASGWPALDVSTSFQTYVFSFALIVALCCYVLGRCWHVLVRRS